MKLYVPEIGDQLRLTANWTFTLYDEGRNSSLWTAVDALNHPTMLARTQEAAIRYEDAVQFAKDNLTQDMQDRVFHMGRLWSIWQNSEPVSRQFNKLVESWKELSDGMANVPATIPAGSVLKTDRIFIRKGMEDWSSLTFFLVSSPDPRFGSKKKIRFWAKLSDCNQIEFDLVA